MDFCKPIHIDLDCAMFTPTCQPGFNRYPPGNQQYISQDLSLRITRASLDDEAIQVDIDKYHTTVHFKKINTACFP